MMGVDRERRGRVCWLNEALLDDSVFDKAGYAMNGEKSYVA